MFTIQHLWIVKRGKGSKIMGAVEHSCWNCANIYKLVRRYFASPVSLNQQALLASISFACSEAFLFVCYGILIYIPLVIGPESDHWECLSLTDSLTH